MQRFESLAPFLFVNEDEKTRALMYQSHYLDKCAATSVLHRPKNRGKYFIEIYNVSYSIGIDGIDLTDELHADIFHDYIIMEKLLIPNKQTGQDNNMIRSL